MPKLLEISTNFTIFRRHLTCLASPSYVTINVQVKVKQSRYRPGVSQRVPGS
jgi:hypothetical protein